MERKLTTVYRPAAHPGFLGTGHTARPVITIDYRDSDPFILLMDDWLEKTDYSPAGGPHPHAGFETVSLLLQGDFGEGEDAMRAGDFEMMTAGSGIVHTETITRPTNMRLLQLWLNLPKAKRNATPRLQRLTRDHVPVFKNEGVSARVYSGTFAGVKSPIDNHTPLIVTRVEMQSGTTISSQLPRDYSAFVYVLKGSIQIGEQGQSLLMDEVGWLNREETPGESQVTITALEDGAEFVLYAAQPQHDEIVSHGPFIADTVDDIKRLYADYRAGRIGHINEIEPERHLVY